jgi:hypothetical protein
LLPGATGSDLWAGSRLGLGSGQLLGPGAGLAQSTLLDGGGFDGGASSSGGHFTEVLPAGCAPDAYKLFVGNVPKSLTEEELRPVRVLSMQPLHTHTCTWPLAPCCCWCVLRQRSLVRAKKQPCTWRSCMLLAGV